MKYNNVFYVFIIYIYAFLIIKYLFYKTFNLPVYFKCLSSLKKELFLDLVNMNRAQD